MHVIRLPKHLPATSELVALNQRLHNGGICLDWSDVQTAAEPEQLETLFAGFRLSEHIDLIGAETVPEVLMPAIIAAFETVEKQAMQQTATAATLIGQQDGHPGAMPALWLPEAETVTNPEEDVEEEPFVVQKQNATSTAQVMPAVAPVLNVPTPARLRDMLEDMVLRDLLGPAGGEEEEIEEARVHDRYLIGMLAPNDLQTAPEEQDPLAIAEEGPEESGPADIDATQTPSLNPSSMGMSFCVNPDAPGLLVTVRWGQYTREHSETLTNAQGAPRRVWRRKPRGGTTRFFPLKEGRIEAWKPEREEQPDVFVKGIMRRSPENWTVTLFLVNGQHTPSRLQDEAWLFQPEMMVEAPDGLPIFQQRSSGRQMTATDEGRAMAMLYRWHVSFAIGHGVSVHAQTLSHDPTCAIRLSTCFAPCYDVPFTQAPTSAEIPALSDLVLDMKALAESAEPDLPKKLEPLVTAYAAWIDEQEQRLGDLSSHHLHGYQKTARDVLGHCRNTLARIRAGIDLLTSNQDASRAFAFLNRAMWQQRIHTLYAEERRRESSLTLEAVDTIGNRSWRPFQLAFILLNLLALTDLHHPDRREDADAIADLLWFPTGGGKTEAYLGLTAYTLAIRRLQGTIEGRSGQDGVAVLMRYTLRLLTLQQFQRASSLICACEMIRRQDPTRWGGTPFRLGLWVGQRSTPNTTEESQRASTSDHGTYSSNFGGIGSPRQLTRCPWCGLPIEGGKNIHVESYTKGRGRTFIYCSDPYGQCPWSFAQSPDEGLPVLVVDEEIYRLLPALLISTVDKFAQLPWRGQTQMLFGQVDKYCSRHGFRSPDLEDKDAHKASGKYPAARSFPHAPLRPPDLIIQDELHLISGPLGTLVGLYETAVDYLCTWEVDGRKVRPKVIAATATIRQASQQIEALFLRKVSIFPPQGIDVEDNFFSRQRQPSEQTPGRRYLGICANGRRMKAALIRVYVAFLSAAQVLYSHYGAAADPWMTLVGYFNSMSELGGMRRLVDDDVRKRIWEMDKRGLARRSSPVVEELTSRKSSSMIPEVLGKLERSFGTTPYPIDVLLATNMISVGVDVKRLGLMVVTGQPKTTAEYIQATSRVGRSYPGLVCIVYNWARPRDLSHYEQFEHYHATFYQQVEALSVTPFAPRALDRGLAALLTSIVRLSGPAFNKNDAAGNVAEATNLFDEAITVITRRAEEIAKDAEAVERVRTDLEKLRHYWVQKASTIPALGYKKQQDSLTLGLLKEPERGKWEPFTCLNSLRDVEPTVNLILDERDLGEDTFH